ncbi:MAG: 2-oxoacid:acceptor oxidoreductase subunit alpha [Peptococcaceae bacterium]
MGRYKFLQGNEACVEGAIAAGARFFAGYPITPSSEIAQQSSIKLPAIGGYYIQMEDEIASMAAIIGASLTGMKSFTATSGPGFSLMQENLGVAIIGEVPCVIMNVSRGGPSTGLATKPAQGDVMQVRWGTHGDHSIIVLTPSSAQECFDLTIEAFNLSEKYRTPVILLTDKSVGHLREKVYIRGSDEIQIINRKKPDVKPENYLPYKADSDGIPPLACYGEEHLLKVNSSMHGEDGLTKLTSGISTALNMRLIKKIEDNVSEISDVRTFQVDDAEIMIISFGISARSSRKAVTKARALGLRVGLIQILGLWPFPAEKIRNVLKNCSYVVVVEMNMGQLASEVEQVFRDKTIYRVNKCSGEDIVPNEIIPILEEVASSL